MISKWLDNSNRVGLRIAIVALKTVGIRLREDHYWLKSLSL